MSRIILLGLFFLIQLSCKKDASHESFYESWVKDNYSALNKVDQIVYSDNSFNKIWAKQPENIFSLLKDDRKTIVHISDTHEIRDFLPEHNNMLYLINESGIFVGVGLGAECEGVDCSISVAKFREGGPNVFCSDVPSVKFEPRQKLCHHVCLRKLVDMFFTDTAYLIRYV